MLTMVKPYVTLEEKLTTHFDKPIFIESRYNLLTRKESHQHQDDSYRRMLVNYDKYTPLTVSHDKIYQNCVNALASMH